MASSKPSPKEVVVALKALSEEKTKQLFYHLDLPLHIMSNIEGKHSGGMLTIHCVDEWINSDLDASWGKIVAGLREIGMNKLAQEVATQHHVETPPSVGSHDPITSEVTSDTTESPPSNPITSVFPPRVYSTDPVQRVQEEVEQLQESFTNMMSMAQSSLCKRESEELKFVDGFRNYLLFLPLSKKAPHIKFFDEREDDIINAKTILKLLAILGRYCNYSNYDLLLHLINKFCNSTEKKRMQDYCKSVEKFEIATPVNIYLVAISASTDILQKFSEIVMKMNKQASKCTLHEVRKFKEALCNTAELHSYSVYTESVAKSSVKMVLRVPPNCIGLVLAALTPDFLHTHHLIEVSVNGQHLKIEEELVCVCVYTCIWVCACTIACILCLTLLPTIYMYMYLELAN